ncbi:alpha/beta hydrolase [Luteibacter yeojuensis]|uniref:Alpha/beta hydrolase n=1 Tax=Luteibacter yeojuensis TaxID=345309 RepID=A0A7X5TPG5_9GAMM|nr:alpha/beta hydrolase [Luteibacter yeojuensis]NID15035.1 alpha/beta hydrolase [Luteibacter yeojuensis]
MPKVSLPSLAALLALTLPAPAFAVDATPGPRPGEIAVEHGVATASDGSTMPYEIGTLYVPENRAKPGSRPIGVGFVRVKATHPTKAPPIVLLAGGPGITMLDIVLDRDDAAKRRVKVWQGYAEIADLIVIEQRGYTLRGDMMTLKVPAAPLDKASTIEADIETMRSMARAARTAYPKADLSGYSIGEMADDVDDLRKALGYDRVSLVAASFGSQWAFAVMKRHPGRTARTVISSAEPLDYGYDIPSHVFAVMQRIAVEAEQDPALKPYMPEGGLTGAIQATLQRFRKGDATVIVPGENGATRKLVLGLGDYQQALVNYAGDASEFPAFVLSAYHRHYDEWARDSIGWRAAEDRSLINPLVNIGLDMSAERKDLLWTDPALPIVGGWNFASYLATKGEWATPDPGDAFRHAVQDPTPILFVQGDWDASTPIENTFAMAPYFPNSRTVVVHRAQHGGTFQLLRSRPALLAKVGAFLRTGETRDLPSEISLDAVTFRKPGFPPPGT